jgi:hypothetical protein
MALKGHSIQKNQQNGGHMPPAIIAKTYKDILLNYS